MSSNKRETLRKRAYFYYAKYRHFAVNHFVSERARRSTIFNVLSLESVQNIMLEVVAVQSKFSIKKP